MPFWAWREVAKCDVPDLRRRKSLARILVGLCGQSGVSLSVALGHGLRQAAHRIFEHEGVSVSSLMAGHVQETVKRPLSLGSIQGSECCLILVAQDTTSLNYSTHQALEGIGPITTAPNTMGLLAHSALAMTEAGLPLGVVHLSIWSRSKEDRGSRNQRKHRETKDKESQKWLDALKAIEAAYPAEQRLLIIQDREADVFDFLSAPRRAATHLLLRAAQKRRVLTEAGEEGTLFDTVAGSPIIGQYSVTIPRKPGVAEHKVIFDLRVLPLSIGQKQLSQAIWVVRATQSNAPEGADPLEWTLLTTLPVEGAAQAQQIVEYYTRRWMIERLHFTLKSGCNVERLQIDDSVSLRNALAMYYIVAWRILFLTYLARSEPDMPVDGTLTKDEITVLSASIKKKVTTIEVAITAICKLGGYQDYANAKDPGVKSFWIGIRKLEAMVEGWKLAMSMQNMQYES